MLSNRDLVEISESVYELMAGDVNDPDYERIGFVLAYIFANKLPNDYFEIEFFEVDEGGGIEA